MNAEKLNMTYEEISKKNWLPQNGAKTENRRRKANMSNKTKMSIHEYGRIAGGCRKMTPLPPALTPTYNDGTAPQEEEATVETR